MEMKDIAQKAKKVLAHSTVLGKLWHFVSVIFRMVVVATVGTTVYGDNSLKCITSLPACEEMCFNTFAPISPWTFWVVQLIFCSLPMACFQGISHFCESRFTKKMSSQAIGDQGESTSKGEFPRRKETSFRGRQMPGGCASEAGSNSRDVAYKHVYDREKSKKIFRTTAVKIAYLIFSIIRTLLEVGFCFIMHKLYSYENLECFEHARNRDDIYCNMKLPLKMPTLYFCEGPAVSRACNQGHPGTTFVPCFVPRYYEKSIFHSYMAIVTYFCIAFSSLDVIWVGFKLLRQASSCGRKQKASQQDMASSSNGASPNKKPTPKLFFLPAGRQNEQERSQSSKQGHVNAGFQPEPKDVLTMPQSGTDV